MGVLLSETADYVVKVGKQYYPLRANQFTYANISDLTGVSVPADGLTIEPKLPISSLVRTGKVFAMNVRTADKKNHRVYCSIDKVSGIGGLLGKTINNSKITTAGGRVRRYIK
jgi:hypothetical protein